MTQDFRRKKIRVLPTGVEPMTFWLVLRMLCHCAIGVLWQVWLFNWVYGDKLLAYCWTGMSNVMLLWNEEVYGDVNEDGKVEAWLCKWKMMLFSERNRQTRKKELRVHPIRTYDFPISTSYALPLSFERFIAGLAANYRWMLFEISNSDLLRSKMLLWNTFFKDYPWFYV